MDKKIRITGISYDESKYLQNQETILSHFKNKFEESKFSVDVKYTNWQPSNEAMIFPGIIMFYIIWAYSYFVFFLSFNKSRLKTRAFFATIFYMLRKFIGRDTETSARSTPRYMYLDQVLTAKHLFAMRDFLESKDEYLLIVCDDVMENHAVELNYESFINLLNQHDSEKGIFVELAPFYELAQLKHDFNYQIKSKYESNFYCVDFFANTAACYLVDRKAASLIVQEVFERPQLTKVSIDWMLTYISKSSVKRNELIYWTIFPQPYLNSSLYTGDGGLVGSGDAIVSRSIKEFEK